MKIVSRALFLFLMQVAFVSASISACTNLIVTKGASSDGSVMVTYTCDGEFHPHMTYTPPEDHAPGDLYELKDWSGNVVASISQPPRTHGVVYLMNEYQVVIGETTFTGREELVNEEGILHYWWLMRIALQRAKTAREAVVLIGELVEEYGYRSTGESISIGDKNEAWLLEITGKGPGEKGANWVALRIPDGYICAHANKARIGEFPLKDSKNCLYSEDVIDFAIRKGYYDPSSGKPFSFHKAYCPSPPQKLRYCETRVWSIFRRAAPSKEFSSDYHRGVKGADPYPLWIKPDKKLSREDVFALMRDHYEGTPYDMTCGVDAGPFGTPNRWRPMNWNIDGSDYTWERPISTQQTGFSFVSQSRSYLPDAIGGVFWYGVDDTYFSVYIPFYACTDRIPETLAEGSMDEFSWDSAWWVFNFVANYANLRYDVMKNDIIEVQAELENNLSAMQPAVEKAALELYKNDPTLAADYLTDYSENAANRIVKQYRGLAELLIRKYNDGYIQHEKGRAKEEGYSEKWLRKVLELHPEKYRLNRWESDSLETDLPY
ncbi:MAG: C69 family dipeptidase [Candidatus Krumholzibacteriota bacterium]|nr:C69 family dipeptidase [Candidatus Krumholzibacteriota bacterium]